MSITVRYRDFRAKAAYDARALKAELCRDLTWGTFVEDLSAAAATCGTESAQRWRRLELGLENLAAGGPADESFAVTLHDDNFDFEAEGLDHFVATIAGDIVCHRGLESIEVHDVDFDGARYTEGFPGPSVGTNELYERFLSSTLRGVPRPILAFSVKPRRGLSIGDLEALYRAAASAGVDIVEDDERLIDSPGCRFKQRVEQLGALQREFATIYSANITGDPRRAIDRLDYCVQQGIRMVKVDVLACGFETLRQVARRIQREYAGRVAVTVYPDVFGAYRRMGRRILVKLSRLCGADIVYAGSANWARYAEEGGSMNDALDTVYGRHRLLTEPIAGLPHIKPCLPTLTNDQHPSRAEAIAAWFRKEKDEHYRYAFFVGGGISAFPGDIRQACSTWVAWLTHVATTDLGDYEPFRLDPRHEAGMELLGWERLDVQAALAR